MGDFMYENFGWIVAVITILLIGILIFVAYQNNKCCERFESKIVHQEAWTQWVSNGKTMSPIYHPAGNYNKKVCVEPKKECMTGKCYE